MADFISLEFESKTLGLPGSIVAKDTIARFFKLHEDGLHLKVSRNGNVENVWPLSNGKFLLPPSTRNAVVIAFHASDSNDDDDFLQVSASSRSLSFPRASNRSKLQGSSLVGTPLTMYGLGKRPAPGLSFIKGKKKKVAEQVKYFIFSSVDDEGQLVQLFPISINLTEVADKFGHISVAIICSAIEQELRDQGEVVRLVVIDAKGQPIMDSSQTRKEGFWATQRTFRAMSQQIFKKWKPSVWAAVNTGLYTLEEEEYESDLPKNLAIHDMSFQSSSLEVQHQNSSFAYAQSEDKFSEIKSMFAEIKDTMQTTKEVKKLKEVFKCVICQSTCAASMYFCVTGCGQLIGCYYCASKIDDCPLCRVSLPDTEIRKPLSVGGLAGCLGIPEISMKSALKEANLDEDEVDDDDDIL